jgi:alpha-1,6-mannosyltransferase
MKILDLGEFYSERGGGVRSYLSALLEASACRGHEVIIVAPGPRNAEERVAGGRIIRYRAPRMPYDGTYHLPFRIDVMRRWVRELEPDVLQLSSPYVPWIAASGLTPSVRSYVYHSDPIGAYVHPMATRWLPKGVRQHLLDGAWSWMRRVCHSCDLTVVAGEWLRDELEAHGIRHIECLPFGIAHESFGTRHCSSKLRSELLGPLAGDPEARLLVMGGRLAVEKRQALLVRAVAELARSRPIALLVLGDGPERARLEDLARRTLKVFHFLPFTRDRQHYAQVLASADALVHGSRCETYGFLLVEALASGTPLVVPDAGGAAHVGDSACLECYPANADERGIALAIDRLLERPRAETQRGALAAARRHPTKQEHFDRLFALYESRLPERRRPSPPRPDTASSRVPERRDSTRLS